MAGLLTTPAHGPFPGKEEPLHARHGNAAAQAGGRRCDTELARRIRGTLHKPGDPAYQEACRIWNAMIERRPAFVVRPRDAADVAATIGFANEHGLPLSVRGGGHNVAGAALSDGGITIDMSQRRAVEVDPARGAVRVEPGATWKDVDAATQPHGLVVPSGIISATGVAGFTLGAGFGWTSRKFGFAADNLLAVEVVTADGKIRSSERKRKRRPVLGAARRQRQFRRGDVVRVPRPPARAAGALRHAGPSLRARPRRDAALPRGHRGRARRAHHASSSCARRRRRPSSRRSITASRSPR